MPLNPERMRRGYWRRLWYEIYRLLEPDPLAPSSWLFLGGPPWLMDADPDDGDFEPLNWDPARWTETYRRAMSLGGDGSPDVIVSLVGFLTLHRLAGALRSRDLITHSLASAAFLPSDSPELEQLPPPASPPATVPEELVSTMIHGTWAYKGDWWTSDGDFHRFIQTEHRSKLFGGGADFDWSGKCSKSHRERAGKRFSAWAKAPEVAPGGLRTVFGHSFGGEIAARALLRGAPVRELVLLSAPVTTYVEQAAESGLPILDVRLKFDAVLGLARLRQRVKQELKPRGNVTQVVLDRWIWEHGATHSQDVWETQKVAQTCGTFPL